MRHFGFYSFELGFRFRAFYVVFSLRFRKLGFHLRFDERAVVYKALTRLCVLLKHLKLLRVQRQLRIKSCDFRFRASSLFIVLSRFDRHFSAVPFFEQTLTLGFELCFHSVAVIGLHVNNGLILTPCGERRIKSCDFGLRTGSLFIVFGLLSSHFRTVSLFENTLTLRFFLFTGSLFFFGKLFGSRADNGRWRYYADAVSASQHCSLLARSRDFRVCAGSLYFGLRFRPFALNLRLRLGTGFRNLGVGFSAY